MKKLRNKQNRSLKLWKWDYGHCCGLRLCDRIRNEAVREQIVVDTTSLINTIETKSLQWYGDMQRMKNDRMVSIITWTPLEYGDENSHMTHMAT